jgi:DNA-binding NarL/FixJ family response regulator
MTISVLLLDDHLMVREGLAALLGRENDLRVAGSFGNASDALRFAAESPPNVAVIDIALPGLDGIETTRVIHDSCPETHILMLSMHASSEHVYQSLRAGASGYMLKESAIEELVAAVRAVHAGRLYLSKNIASPALDQYLSDREAGHPLERITPRELQVLKLIVEGHTSNEVGKILGLSPKSVDSYRSRIMLKLHIEDLPGLVKFAIRHGITTV